MTEEPLSRIGRVIRGRVIEHRPFGIMVDIGEQQPGVVVVTMLEDEPRSKQPAYPAVGQEIDAVLLGFTAIDHQPRLSMRPSDIARARDRYGDSG